MSWNSLSKPLPLTPNVKRETVLTTLLKLYAVRVDVTSFFRHLWIPVFPSILAVISNTETNDSFTFKSLVKVAMRLLAHTFSERSIVSFPATATAVSRALFALAGRKALYTYLFDLLILPNLVKILLLADHDNVGGEVLRQYFLCYSQTSWWPEIGTGQKSKYNPISTLIWIIWRLFSGAVGIDSLKLSTLSTVDFFSNGPTLDVTSMPDQRLQYLLSTLRRTIQKSCQILLHLSLDVTGSELCNFDPIRASVELKDALPHLSDNLDNRLQTLLPKPIEMVQTVVLSRYEAATIFDSINNAINSKVVEEANESDSLLKQEIASYHMLG